MRILVDLGHPAHVHLFRHAIQEWRDRGHDVALAARDKDITTDLLQTLGCEYTVASRARSGKLGLFVELLEHDWQVFRLARRRRSQLLLGTSVSITHAAKPLRAQSIVFNEDDADVARTFARLAYPFADFIVTPRCVRGDYGQKHVRYDSYHELAYLHPDRFTPDPTVREDLGLAKDEPFYILRFVSLAASHDWGEQGIDRDMRRRLYRRLSETGRVFISCEGEAQEWMGPHLFPLSPQRMHDAVFFARLLVGESQSMAMEAAVLGTPSIRCNSFVGRCSVLQEIEHEYGLTFGFRPGDAEEMLAAIPRILHESPKHVWQERLDRLLQEKVDLTTWMVNFVESFA